MDEPELDQKKGRVSFTSIVKPVGWRFLDKERATHANMVVASCRRKSVAPRSGGSGGSGRVGDLLLLASRRGRRKMDELLELVGWEWLKVRREDLARGERHRREEARWPRDQLRIARRPGRRASGQASARCRGTEPTHRQRVVPPGDRRGGCTVWQGGKTKQQEGGENRSASSGRRRRVGRWVQV